MEYNSELARYQLLREELRIRRRKRSTIRVDELEWVKFQVNCEWLGMKTCGLLEQFMTAVNIVCDKVRVGEIDAQHAFRKIVPLVVHIDTLKLERKVLRNRYVKHEKVIIEAKVNGDEGHCYICENNPLFVQYEFIDNLHTNVFYTCQEHRIYRSGVSWRTLVRQVQGEEGIRNGEAKPVEFKAGLISNRPQ